MQQQELGKGRRSAPGPFPSVTSEPQCRLLQALRLCRYSQLLPSSRLRHNNECCVQLAVEDEDRAKFLIKELLDPFLDVVTNSNYAEVWLGRLAGSGTAHLLISNLQGSHESKSQHRSQL